MKNVKCKNTYIMCSLKAVIKKNSHYHLIHCALNYVTWGKHLVMAKLLTENGYFICSGQRSVSCRDLHVWL